MIFYFGNEDSSLTRITTDLTEEILKANPKKSRLAMIREHTVKVEEDIKPDEILTKENSTKAARMRHRCPVCGKNKKAA